jgi:hypothetical protein
MKSAIQGLVYLYWYWRKKVTPAGLFWSETPDPWADSMYQ